MITNYHIDKEYIKQFLPTNPIILEAGAHKGRDTQKLLETWPNAIIHAFEPLPDLFNNLQATLGKQVSCYNYALSMQTGTAQFNVSERCTAASSLLEPTGLKIQKPHLEFLPIEVHTITLAEWSKKYSVPVIDFMWLDLQGMELPALQAAGQLLASTKVIHTEINLIERYAGATNYDKLRAFLENNGFTMLIEAVGPFQWGNALFIRKNSDLKI